MDGIRLLGNIARIVNIRSGSVVAMDRLAGRSFRRMDDSAITCRAWLYPSDIGSSTESVHASPIRSWKTS